MYKEIMRIKSAVQMIYKPYQWAAVQTVGRDILKIYESKNLIQDKADKSKSKIYPEESVLKDISSPQTSDRKIIKLNN